MTPTLSTRTRLDVPHSCWLLGDVGGVGCGLGERWEGGSGPGERWEGGSRLGDQEVEGGSSVGQVMECMCEIGE